MKIKKLNSHEIITKRDVVEKVNEIVDYINKDVKKEPKYKVDDYVEYICGGEKCRGHITWYKDNYYGIDNYYGYMKEDSIIGYAKPDLLTKEEKEYLSAVIKPFKDKVTSICKVSFGEHTAFIAISFRNFNGAGLPSFNRNVMYKGMELDRKYTLEELGL